MAITRAIQEEGCIMLILDNGDTYALYADDPYGEAPALREELQRAVDAGEITIEPGPYVPPDPQEAA